MIDLNKIGNRIKEQRKYILKVSQEKMAEDLGMYQADISNMEKAKSGSGISDLVKLDMLAEYFDIPLESLLFGSGNQNMLTYHGSKMLLKESKRKMTKSHKDIILKLTGQKQNDDDNIHSYSYECGPFMLHSLIEKQILLGEDDCFAEDEKSEFTLHKLHTYIFFGNELVGTMTASVTSLMDHVHQMRLKLLQQMLPSDILDVTDVVRTLNPYWAFLYFARNEVERQQYLELTLERMDELRSRGQFRPVLYVESVYVKEDCRQKGIFRMYIDFLKKMFDGAVLWLNMEPTSGTEMDEEYTCLPSYTISELGQVNLNAVIAEKLGFTIDPDTWHRQAETVDAEGNLSIETVLIRKCAYYLPAEIRSLIKNDGTLVAEGRAKQQLLQKTEENSIIDLYHRKIGNDIVVELRITQRRGKTYFVSVTISPNGTKHYIVSYNSRFHKGKEWILEEYSFLDEAEGSDYLDELKQVHAMSLMYTFESCDDNDFENYEENFDVITDHSATLSDDLGCKVADVMEVELKRTNTAQIGEIVYAFIYADCNNERYYAINKKSFFESHIDGNVLDFERLEPIVEFSSDESMKKSKYCPLFSVILEHM